MTYADAVDWAIKNILMDFYDRYDDWFNACAKEFQIPELTRHPDFIKMMKQAWNNEVGDITKSRQQLEQEESEQKRIEEFVETEIPEQEVREPTAREVEQELARNLPDESPVKRKILGGVEQNITITTVPQKTDAPIKITRSPTGITTMTRPPTLTPAVVKAPVTTTVRQTVINVARQITGGVKKAVGAVRGVFRIRGVR